jgi:glycosyltransferase involved in cell wall biosynthesis
MKTALISPRPTDAISFYRAAGPFRRMREQFSDFDYDIIDTINWALLTRYDNVFLHRGYTAEHVKVAEIAKKWGVPLIGDYDDYLLNLEHDNPAKGVFDNAVKDTLECTRALDLTFVTTEYLKGLLEQAGAKNVVVAPNAYDAKLFPYAAKKKDKLKICLWRGSNTHNKDVMSVLPGLERLFKTFPDWQFVFVASNPSWMFRHTHSNVHFVGSKDILEYMHMMYEMAPSVVYHPLFDSDFNRAKSMCSWLEATHAGAAFVGPEFEEFTRPGITNYKPNDPESFFESMKSLLSNPIKIEGNYRESAEYIARELTLERVNEIRMSAIKRL